ncbi:MAG TPA: DUF5668 domain-containing protein [Terriglobales bacterium]|nr:DUF5668 domain-containing protein [Terriglobales bacterium]
MNGYKPNPACGCERCRRSGLMGPVMLITVGALFLMANYTRFDFGESWPILLIVAGLMIFLRSSASAEGHRDRYMVATPPPPAAAATPATPSTHDQNPPTQVN